MVLHHKYGPNTHAPKNIHSPKTPIFETWVTSSEQFAHRRVQRSAFQQMLTGPPSAGTAVPPFLYKHAGHEPRTADRIPNQNYAFLLQVMTIKLNVPWCIVCGSKTKKGDAISCLKCCSSYHEACRAAGKYLIPTKLSQWKFIHSRFKTQQITIRAVECQSKAQYLFIYCTSAFK